MKRFPVIVAMMLFSQGIMAQKPTFHVTYSEPLAVFVFVKNLTEQYGDNPFKNAFQKSAYYTPTYRNLVAQLDTLRINYVYSFSEYPYGSKIPGMTEPLLKKNLIASRSIADFKNRSIGFIPNSAFQQLVTILTAFTPIYNELIFAPNKEKFEQQLDSISGFIATRDVGTFFAKGLNFYRSEWDLEIPFEIAFYPLPEANGFTAEAFFNHAVSAIETDLEDYNVLLSVMLHEIFHILYDEQPLAVKQQLNAYFSGNPSKTSTYANMLLNEVLATAVGNGYVYEQLNGKTDTAEWYNWPYINLMAKQIYPVVFSYMQQQKPIDKDFVDMYIKAYEQHFPHWINETDHTMMYRYMLSENPADFETIRQLYPYCSMMEAEDRIDEASIQKMKATPITKIIIVSGRHKEKLSLIKKAFPELKNWKFNAEREFTFNMLLADKTQLYIINQLGTPIAQLLKKLAKQPG